VGVKLISEALDLQQKDIVVLVGAGGKTTIINRLVQEMQVTGAKVAVTTTTKMFAPTDYNLLVITGASTNWRHAAVDKITRNNYVVIGKEVDPAGKITALSMREVQEIWQMNCVDIMLIEGDGAKGRAFKAPRQHEPAIPEFATIVVPVVGAECIGKPLVEEYFHAIEQISALTGLDYGDIVTEKIIAGIMLHPEGYKKNVPPNARWIPFINKVENKNEEREALNLARILKKAGTEKIIVGAARCNPPVRKIC